MSLSLPKREKELLDGRANVRKGLGAAVCGRKWGAPFLPLRGHFFRKLHRFGEWVVHWNVLSITFSKLNSRRLRRRFQGLSCEREITSGANDDDRGTIEH